jgi:hypothetical protein
MNASPASKFKVYTKLQEEISVKIGGNPKDRDIASRVVAALNKLQDAMDAAALAGLIIEPAFKQFSNRFKELGTGMETYVGQVEIYRRLA